MAVIVKALRELSAKASDRESGAVEELTIPCGSSREAACPPPGRAKDDRPHVHRTDDATYRPSMFVTLTLGSYGKVIPPGADGRTSGAGSAVWPSRYDYRRAAVEAMFFTRLFDRWLQNLRRCAGFVVQYFCAIEPQRRLAPHIHLAIRGAIPRQVIRAVTQATYPQLWWPPFDQPVLATPSRGEIPRRAATAIRRRGSPCPPGRRPSTRSIATRTRSLRRC